MTYTPTMEQVRQAGVATYTYEQFDRWLNSVKAVTWDEAKEAFLAHGTPGLYRNPYRADAVVTDGALDKLAQLLNPTNTKIEVTGYGSPCDECDAPYSLWKGWDDDRGELDICFECHLDGHWITDEEKEEWRKEWAMERSDLVAKLIRYDTNKYWSLYGRYFLPKEEKE